MSYWWILLFALWSGYGIWIVNFLRKVFARKILYLTKSDHELNAKLPAAARYDVPILDTWRVYLGAVILLPIRVLATIPFLLIAYLLIMPMKLIFNVNVNNNQEAKGQFYVSWQVRVLKIFLPPVIFCLGISKVSHRKMKIRDVLANYKPIQKEEGPAPLVVCNHVSWLDPFFFMMFNISFLAKLPVAKIPIVGTFAVARQCIFVKRESEDNRNVVIDQIKQRIERVKSHNDISPLLIFPEGTTTNGRTLINFKKGAFVTGDRIKILALKFNPGPLEYVWSIGNMPSIFSFIFGLSQLYNSVEVIEYEDAFDPHWVYATKNIKCEDEHAWEEVAKVVQSLMAFAGGFQIDDKTHHRDLIELEKSWSDMNSKILGLPPRN